MLHRTHVPRLTAAIDIKEQAYQKALYFQLYRKAFLVVGDIADQPNNYSQRLASLT